MTNEESEKCIPHSIQFHTTLAAYIWGDSREVKENERHSLPFL